MTTTLKLPNRGVVYINSTKHEFFDLRSSSERENMVAFYDEEVGRGASVSFRVEENKRTTVLPSGARVSLDMKEE